MWRDKKIFWTALAATLAICVVGVWADARFDDDRGSFAVDDGLVSDVDLDNPFRGTPYADGPGVTITVDDLPTTSVAPMPVADVEAVVEDLGLEVARVVTTPTGDDMAIVEVSGEDALGVWQALRSRVPETGRYPVIIGPLAMTGESGIVAFSSNWEGRVDLAAARAEADGLDLERFLLQRRSYSPLTLDELERSDPFEPGDFWLSDLLVTRDAIDMVRYVDVEIALLPAATPGDVPLVLQMGGWNDMPGPAELSAVIAAWSRAYDAEVVGVGFDSLEIIARSPSPSIDLAIDMAGFAPDTPVQSRTGHWTFWWD